jgi:hypothetical protein
MRGRASVQPPGDGCAASVPTDETQCAGSAADLLAVDGIPLASHWHQENSKNGHSFPFVFLAENYSKFIHNCGWPLPHAIISPAFGYYG